MHFEGGELIAISSHMRVLWGFQILPAETLNWNMSEESDLAFRAVNLSVEIKI